MRAVVKDLGNRGYKPLQGRKHPTTSEDAGNAWGGFRGKSSVLNALLHEQYHLCCYSEVRADEEELGYHIEHVENKSQHPARTFDPTNLAACAIDSNLGFAKLKAQPGDLKLNLFGGHARLKAQSVDMTLFIHPHQAHSSAFFRYLSDGRIIPNPDLGQSTLAHRQADYTITQLNLNSPYLKTLRRSWWNELNGKDESRNDQPAVLSKLAQVDLLPTHAKLNRFFSLTRQFYGPLAEQALAQNAPELA
jgi:uncharacterized protein (TIGR02646 family)